MWSDTHVTHTQSLIGQCGLKLSADHIDEVEISDRNVRYENRTGVSEWHNILFARSTPSSETHIPYW